MDPASELVSTAVNEFGEWAYLSVIIGVVVCFDDGALEKSVISRVSKEAIWPYF
jgi:hypothetical protein